MAPMANGLLRSAAAHLAAESIAFNDQAASDGDESSADGESVYEAADFDPRGVLRHFFKCRRRAPLAVGARSTTSSAISTLHPSHCILPVPRISLSSSAMPLVRRPFSRLCEAAAFNSVRLIAWKSCFSRFSCVCLCSPACCQKRFSDHQEVSQRDGNTLIGTARFSFLPGTSVLKVEPMGWCGFLPRLFLDVIAKVSNAPTQPNFS